MLNKLCSANPLCWADLVAAYGEGSGEGSSGGSAKTGAEGMVQYLAASGVTAKLNAAVNKLAEEKPADPMAYLIKLLQQ